MIDPALRIVYMGTPEFAVPALQRLIASGACIVAAVTQPDRPAGRHQEVRPCAVAALAREHQIPVIQPLKLRTGEFARALAELEPDLFVTAAYGRILPPDVLAIPRLGPLNIHGSLLPRHRGASPVQAAIIAGDPESGVTIMMMDEGMDTGDILLQRAIPIDFEDTAGSLSDKLAQLGADMILPAIAGLADGTLRPVPQDHSQATLTRILTREDGEINWNQPAGRVYDFIRGCTPWPGSYTWVDGRRLKVHRARVMPPDAASVHMKDGCEAGTVCGFAAGAILVACGSGILELLEIQTEAGRRMSCRDCGHNYRLGTRFGR